MTTNPLPPARVEQVAQADRDAAARFYEAHLSRPNEVPVSAHMRAGKIDESPLIQLLARHRQAQWKTIESAPKNVGILGFWMLDDNRGHIDRVWWDHEFEQAEWDEAADEPTYRGAWTAGRVASWGYEEYAEEHPTHWQPLPAPPEIRTLSDEGAAG